MTHHEGHDSSKKDCCDEKECCQKGCDCSCGSASCGCVCHRMNGIIVALIGVDFLLAHFEVLSSNVTSVVWPVLLVLLGLQNSLGRGLCKCCSKCSKEQCEKK